MSDEENDKALTVVEKSEGLSVAVEDGAAVPKTLDEQLRFAKWSLASGLLPHGVTTVAAAWVVMQRGAELGFPGLSAFDFLYVVKGRVRVTPDCVKAKALASGLLEDARAEVGGEGETMVARVTVKRRGLPTPVVGEFSVKDAKTAQLWGKVGRESGQPSSWVTYPRRMLLARARGFAYGDAFRDLIGGLQVRERFDLDPGETIGDAPAEPIGRKAEVPLPPATPHPLIAELAGEAPPFESHAQADAAIAAQELVLTPPEDGAKG